MDIPTLPAPPRALAAILEAASDPDVPMDQLASFVAMDPTFASTVLQVANTARYRGTRKEPITNVRLATLRLGVRSLRNFALCHTARSCASAQQLPNFNLTQFWEDSLRCAVANEILAERLEGLDPNTAFTVGLLQELGVLAMLLKDPDQCAEYDRVAHLAPDVRLSSERRAFGATHPEVAAHLAETWGLPPDLAIPLAYHHHPQSAPPEGLAACQVAEAAELLAILVITEHKEPALARARNAVEALLGPDTLESALEELAARVKASGSMLGIEVGEQPELDTILKAANQRLVAENLSYEDLVSQLELAIAEKEHLTTLLNERNRELERLATIDPLTGLFNRRELFARSEAELLRVARHGSAVALITCDIDHFKMVNDTWGHPFGDEVLRGVSAAILGCVRNTDLLARTGGEEFTALLPRTNSEGALVLAKRMLRAVSRMRFLTPDRQEHQVTVSLGIAWVEGSCHDALDAQELLTRWMNIADQALYASKDGGRNRVTHATSAVPWLAQAA